MIHKYNLFKKLFGESITMSNLQNAPFQSPFAEMDQSIKVKRWYSGPSNQTQNVFARYGTVQQSSQQAEGMKFGTEQNQQKRFVTEVSQVSYADKFKKIKYSQLQTLKELRQEYEILKNLPLQDDFLKRSNAKRQSVSEYSSRGDAESSSSPSIHLSKKKNRESHSTARDNQALSLQKRQLQLVIGNSMRKIEELLNNQIEYKKIIHQYQLQLDSRNNDGKLDSLAKTMKKNQSEYIEKIQNLKRDIQRLKLINQQLLDRNESLQSELSIRTQQLRKAREEKRVLEDSIRLEKDKYMNLQIDIKRIKMESEINEKDKNNEINRLKTLLQSQPKADYGPSQNQIRRLEEQLRTNKHKYELILQQFERYKRDVSSKPKEVVIKENKGEDQTKIFEAIIHHLKEDSANQSKATMDLLASMVAKIDEKNARERQSRQIGKQKKKGKEVKQVRQPNPRQLQASKRILQQMYNLRNEVSSLRKQREDPNKSIQFYSNLTESMADYQNKIRKLEEQITDGSITKENLLKQYQLLKSNYQYAREQHEKVLADHQRLKQRLAQLQHHGQNYSQQIKGSFRQRENQYEDTIRQLRRKVDEALFLVEKAKKEGQFNVSIARSQIQSRVRLAQEKAERLAGEKQVFRQELSKMRAYYEAKIKQKNDQLQRTAQQFSSLCETKQKALAAYKTNSEAEMNALLRKIQGIASLNERYLLQSNQLSNSERQLHQLRYAVRKMKGMNEGVDHLWQIKQTQYLNVNELLKQIRTG